MRPRAKSRGGDVPSLWRACATIVLLGACTSREPAADASRSERPPDSVTTMAPPAPAPTAAHDGTADEPLAVLRDYYAAIDSHDYARAYAAWDGDGPPGRPTLAAFAAGYSATDSVQLTLGAPGRVEGAAGSRYVTVPVTVRSFERGGHVTVYAGSYTLRRSVVPGADPASLRWHLYGAELRRASP